MDPQEVVAQPPTVSSVGISSIAPTNGYYKAGDTLQATVSFSEAVTVTGTPQLMLTIGGPKPAAYVSGSNSTHLVFGYTLAVGDADTDGIEIAANQLSLNGGTINAADDDTPATLTHTALGVQPSHKVDTTVPMVSSVAISSAAVNGVYKAGETIQALVTFSENVTGTPQLTLNVGGIGKPAAHISGSGTPQLIFGYTVVPGDEDTDGVSVDALLGTVTDAAGNLADLTNAVLGAQGAHRVDAVNPTVNLNGVAITSAPATHGTYKVGETIRATVTFSEIVKVTVPPVPPRVPPQLTLNIGVAGKPAMYTGGSGTTQLVFEYTVVSGDEDTDGIEVAANQLFLNNGTITDGVGNSAVLTHTPLAAQALHRVDTTVPMVSGVSITSAAVNGVYKAGETIQVMVSFSEVVSVLDVPQLTLSVGGIGKSAVYVSGSGTTQLVFGYTVVLGDEDVDGIEIGADQLFGTITDITGNAAILTHAPLGVQPLHRVDTTAPTVSGVSLTSAAVNGVYKVGETIQATVSFSEVVSVLDVPQLTLSIGGVDKSAVYISGSGTMQLIFGYTVVSGDEDVDGIEIGADQLFGTITDATGNTAILTHAALGVQPLHRVDTTAPTVSGVSITSAAVNGVYKVGETIQATVSFSEVVSVLDVPQLTLSIGGVDKSAVYISGSGTMQLIFGYTVVSGDEDVDGIEIGADQLFGTITDATGNAAILTHAALGVQPLHRVDTMAPTVSGVSITSAAVNGVYKAGETIQVTVSFSEVVSVLDVPQLTLNVGGIGKSVVYVSGSGTAQLVFGYTVVLGDEDIDGIEIGADQLLGTITDATGNAAILTHVALGVATLT